MSFRPFARAALAVALVPFVASAQGPRDPSVGRRGQAAITEADLRRDLFTLAGDHFRGREAGTLDELKATTWLVEQARAIGLQPAGDDGTYLQWWSMRRNRIASTSRVTVDGAPLALWTEAVVQSVTDAHVEGPVVNLSGIARDSAAKLALAGKIVVATLQAPPQSTAGLSLQAFRHARFAVVAQAAAYRAAGAAGVVLVADSLAESAMGWLGTTQARGTYAVDSAGVEQRPKAQLPVVLVRRGLAAKVLGAQRAELDLRTESFTYPSVNIVGRLPGKEAQRGEVVLFSGHQDHDGVRYPVDGDSIYNGADDNGSVSVAMLAIARAWKRDPGARPALFVWHGAEERGLLGSSYYAANPTVPRDSIIAVLNADMIGRGHPDSAALMGVQPPHLNSRAVVAAAFAANAQSAKLAVDTLWDRPSHPEGWYFRSDHLPYARRNIPAIEFSTNLHPDYHTPRDEPSRIDYAKLTKMARWMYLTGRYLADDKARPALEPGFRLER